MKADRQNLGQPGQDDPQNSQSAFQTQSLLQIISSEKTYWEVGPASLHKKNLIRRSIFFKSKGEELNLCFCLGEHPLQLFRQHGHIKGFKNIIVAPSVYHLTDIIFLGIP